MKISNFNFKKKFGQNFLTDENILNLIIEKSNIEKNSLIIEIGCGSGLLTKKLIEKGFVIGYEIDSDLKNELSNLENSKIIFGDFLKSNLEEDLKNYNYEKKYIIANLPYYITTPIIKKIIDEKIVFEKIVIMVQKEMGERISAKPKTKSYNSLSVFLNYNFEIKKLIDVSRNSFFPKPNVDSVVIELKKKEKRKELIDENLFYKLIKDSFQQKRKTLKNNLKDYNFEIINEVLKLNGLKENTRAEEISLDLFIEISNKLSNNY